MFVGRIALGIVASLMLCIGARAQTQVLTFQDAEAKGAIWEVVRTLPGCSVGPPRDGGGQVSALVDIDCRQFTGSGVRPGSAITVRLFTRMVLARPWIFQNLAAVYHATTGSGATVFVIRPAPGTVGSIRNTWVEFDVHPQGATQGSMFVTLTAAVSTASLPPPLPNCGGPGLTFFCATNADCSSNNRCASECGNRCLPN